jgi:hypothetical protein
MRPYFKPTGEFEPKKDTTVPNFKTGSAKRILRAGKKRVRALGRNEIARQTNDAVADEGEIQCQNNTEQLEKVASLLFMTREGRAASKKLRLMRGNSNTQQNQDS